MAQVKAAMPGPRVPFTDKNGFILNTWFAFLQALHGRTGGNPLDKVDEALTGGDAAQAAADAAQATANAAQSSADTANSGVSNRLRFDAVQSLSAGQKTQVQANAGLVIGTNVEAHDSDLTAIAGLTPTNDDVLQRKSGAWANRTIAQLMADLATVPHQVPSFTVSGVPSASTAAKIIYVSDEAGGPVLAFSDGTNWRRVTDRSVVS